MKVAVIGSRTLFVNDLENYLPPGVTELVSGGARGIDSCAEEYAEKAGLPIRVFLPNYEENGRQAPLLRNLEIIDYADRILAFWDGESPGTAFVIREAERRGKPIEVIFLPGTHPPPKQLTLPL